MNSFLISVKWQTFWDKKNSLERQTNWDGGSISFASFYSGHPETKWIISAFNVHHQALLVVWGLCWENKNVPTSNLKYIQNKVKSKANDRTIKSIFWVLHGSHLFLTEYWLTALLHSIFLHIFLPKYDWSIVIWIVLIFCLFFFGQLKRRFSFI